MVSPRRRLQRRRELMLTHNTNASRNSSQHFGFFAIYFRGAYYWACAFCATNLLCFHTLLTVTDSRAPALPPAARKFVNAFGHVQRR